MQADSNAGVIEQENVSDHLNRAMPHDSIPKRPPPKTETSQPLQLPMKCKDAEICALKQEHLLAQAKEKPSSISIQTPDSPKKENRPLLESGDFEALRRASQERMRTLAKDVQAAMLKDSSSEGRKNGSFGEHSQQLDILGAHIVLVAGEAAQAKSAEDVASLSWLEDECVQVNELLKKIMPSIALGNGVSEDRAGADEEVVGDFQGTG